jgi:CRP/FNR family cyclic AMP-dependent transcriptional regulator
MDSTREPMNCRKPQAQPTCGFFTKLSPVAMKDIESLQTPADIPANRVLFSEKEPARGVFVVLSGEVKLSINSSDGRRLSLRIARRGEILGLSSTLSGNGYEMTAETLYPATIAPIGRQEFLNFLTRHPGAYQAVTEELSRHVSLACAQLRTVGLSTSAPEKLARLLLDWSDNGQTTELGTRFRFCLTHEQIGEFIGASRETVTRTMGTFKHRRLVAFQGSMVTIPNRSALASYARS